VTGSSIRDVADQQILYMTTIGRRTGLPREIEIWFVVCCDRFSVFAETGEAARWVKDIRGNPTVAVRIGDRQIGDGARSTVTPMANCGVITRVRPSPIANMDGVTACRWKLPLYRTRQSESE
jgi:hypothetical protein